MTKCGVSNQTNIFKNILSDNLLLQSCKCMFTEMIESHQGDLKQTLKVHLVCPFLLREAKQVEF